MISSTHPTLSSFYEKELLVAQLAVQRATILTKKVFEEKEKGTITKDDESPVTIGDFGAQALINHAIKSNFPEDEIMAEEEAGALKQNPKLVDLVWDKVKNSNLRSPDAQAVLGGPIKSTHDMLEAIAHGNSNGGRKGRVWVLDPIDGTKGFLRGGQYAVCLALIVDGQVKVGVLGCPNLNLIDIASITIDSNQNQTNKNENGILLSAVEGQGAIRRNLGLDGLEKSSSIHMRVVKDLSKAIFCESVDASHSSHENQGKIAAELGLSEPSIRMDSQAKYASLAMGMADIYLRFSVNSSYQEKIWDHAAGNIIVREAGGEISDTFGHRLDFGQGRTLVKNKGIIASSREIHQNVIDAVQKVMALR
ncbi:3',5'-bisphosphate nucleotidase [Erysiphe neolycopersici]|uniref:3'(2'),5'-bisphosphate nucleotidase n=1 Tax=Erysiphe neolycopersici TaxID=212602 RepID=A0A420HBL8_9PEZI|nr:3',5'-bisphosphate nucleotidase [Erysiphe neolycopersici]